MSHWWFVSGFIIGAAFGGIVVAFLLQIAGKIELAGPLTPEEK